MEISSLFDKLEGLLPILIFVIWAIISAVGAAAGKNKRKPPQSQQQRQGQAPSQQPSHSSRERDSGGGHSTTISDEMNRALDVIFGNPSADTGHSRRQTRSEPVRKASPPAVHNKKKAVQKAGEKSSMKKGTSAADTVKAIERSANINRKNKIRPIERPAAQPSFSAGEAVKGVVWSEILQPPVSMR